MAKTKNTEEVKNTEELDLASREFKRALNELELNLLQNDYTYEYLKFFLDHLIYWDDFKDIKRTEERVRETLRIIDYNYSNILYRCMATEIITRRINFISVQIHEDWVAKFEKKENK